MEQGLETERGTGSDGRVGMGSGERPQVRSRIVLTGFVLGGILLAACSGDEVPGGGSTTSLADLPRLQPSPTFQLGGVEASRYEAFSRVPRIAVGPEGTLWALDHTTNEIWMYDRQGEFLRAFGGTGDGPGEFSTPWQFGLVGDTVWVRNLTPPFVTFFGPDGSILRRLTVEDPVISRTGVPAGPNAMLAGGSWFSEAVVPWGETAGVHEVALTLTSSGGVVDTVAFTRFPNAFTLPSGGFTTAVYWDPRPALHAVAPDGSGVITADWDEARPGEVELREFGPDARLERVDTVHLDPTPLLLRVADSIVADATAYVEDWMARREASNPGSAPAWADDAEAVVREGLGLGEFFPPIRSVLVGLDGTVWLKRPVAPNHSEWIVLDPDRTPTHRLDFPPGHDLNAASLTAAWTTHTDSLDVPYITRHALTETPGRTP